MNYNMESVIRFNAQTTGRDKLFRLCQFSCHLVVALLRKYQYKSDSIQKFLQLETNFSSSRKLLRLGRCVDVMHSATQTIHLPDPTLRLSLTFSRISSSLYLFCDHMLWLGRVGLLNVDKNRWSEWSDKFWLYSITMNLMRDVYEIINLLKFNASQNLTQKHYFGHSSRIDVIPITVSNNQLLRTMEWFIKHKNICVDTLKNFCDIWIPLSSLGHKKLSPQMIAILGILSSMLSILQIFNYSYRLSPS